METKYGVIETITENGVLKLDFNKSKFNSFSSFIAFLGDKDLCREIFKY